MNRWAADAPDAGPFGATLGQDIHLTGRKIVVATSDRELTAADSGGQIRFSGSQLLDTHGDICPNRVVQLIARLVDHTLHGGTDPFGKTVGVTRNWVARERRDCRVYGATPGVTQDEQQRSFQEIDPVDDAA